MDSVTRFPLDLDDRFVYIHWFEKAEIVSDEEVQSLFLDNRFHLNDISVCWSRTNSAGRYFYYFKRIEDVNGRCRRLYSSSRVKEFEDQFPFFPYYRDVYMSKTFDKKFEIIEQQNIALLSHLETIMIALKLRNADDDNLQLTLQ